MISHHASTSDKKKKPSEVPSTSFISTYQLNITMGVQRKTRKFALAKRAITMRDDRLFVPPNRSLTWFQPTNTNPGSKTKTRRKMRRSPRMI
jgi:hypothetical protein